jgi:anti-anti-sigma factor
MTAFGHDRTSSRERADDGEPFDGTEGPASSAARWSLDAIIRQRHDELLVQNMGDRDDESARQRDGQEKTHRFGSRGWSPGMFSQMDRQLRIEPGEEGGTYSLAGDIDLASAPQVRALVPPEEGPLVLEMSQVMFLGSEGLAALLELAGRSEDGTLIIQSPSSQVRMILDAVDARSTGIYVED